MIVGGVEKALIELLREIDKSRFNVTLLLTKMNGPLEYQIPEGINVKYLNLDITVYDRALLARGRYFAFIRNKIVRAFLHVVPEYYSNTALSVKTWPLFDEEYDAIVAYKADDALVACLPSRFKGRKKVLYVHAEYHMSERAKRSYSKILSGFDSIICVSEFLCTYMMQEFPNCKAKNFVMHNLIDYKKIISLANDSVDYMDSHSDTLSLVTVGRLSSEKGQQMVPQTVRILLDQGYDINWYLVGDGPLREEIQQECEKNNVHDHVVMLGSRVNPYPYIRVSDIYVQPSLSEGWCLTVQEAKILHKAIVSTPFAAVREQIVSGENGLIVDAMTPEALAEGIRQLLDHPEMCEKFTNALKNESFDNAKEMQKLYDFIES